MVSSRFSNVRSSVVWWKIDNVRGKAAVPISMTKALFNLNGVPISATIVPDTVHSTLFNLMLQISYDVVL